MRGETGPAADEGSKETTPDAAQGFDQDAVPKGERAATHELDAAHSRHVKAGDVVDMLAILPTRGVHRSERQWDQGYVFLQRVTVLHTTCDGGRCALTFSLSEPEDQLTRVFAQDLPLRLLVRRPEDTEVDDIDYAKVESMWGSRERIQREHDASFESADGSASMRKVAIPFDISARMAPHLEAEMRVNVSALVEARGRPDEAHDPVFTQMLLTQGARTSGVRAEGGEVVLEFDATLETAMMWLITRERAEQMVFSVRNPADVEVVPFEDRSSKEAFRDIGWEVSEHMHGSKTRRGGEPARHVTIEAGPE